MRWSANFRPATAAILFAALLVRASIPAGYMPASPGSGLLFELCPEGMPAQFVFAQGGSHHHHHGSHDSQHDTAGDDVDHCPLGHMLSAAAAVDHTWQTDLDTAPAAQILPFVAALHGRAAVAQRSRGPPA